MNILKRKHFMQLALSNNVHVVQLWRIKWSSKIHGGICSDSVAQASTGVLISRCNFPSDVIYITAASSGFITGRLHEKQFLLGLF